MAKIDWNEIRRDYPATKNWAYFHSAGMSPMPTPVFETLVAEYRKVLLDGDRFWEADVERFNDLRHEIGTMLGWRRRGRGPPPEYVVDHGTSRRDLQGKWSRRR